MDFIQDLGHLALGSRLKRLSDQMMSSVQEIYRQAGVDFEPRWFPLYRLLADHGPQTVGEAADALGLTHAAISQTARMMTKEKVITSKKDPRDERRRVLSLTESGRAALPRLRPLWSDLERAVREMVSFGGVDILAAIDGIEQAMQREPFPDRCLRIRRSRELDAVDVVDFEPKYADDFARLNIEWLEKYFEVEPVDEEIFAHSADIVKDGGAILFAKIGDEVVGTCALFKVGDTFELAKMAVTEAHQGRHIGKTLLFAALDRAKALGAETVFLVTNSSLVPATSLYRSVGFRVTRSGPHEKYARGDLTMEITL